MEYIRLVDFERHKLSEYLNWVGKEPFFFMEDLARSNLIQYEDYKTTKFADEHLSRYYKKFDDVDSIINSVFENSKEMHQAEFIQKAAVILYNKINEEKNRKLSSQLELLSETQLRVPLIHISGTIATNIKNRAKDKGILNQRGDILYKEEN